jgi:hypothetical protein
LFLVAGSALAAAPVVRAAANSAAANSAAVGSAPVIVIGYGRDVEEAKLNARQQIVTRIKRRMAEYDPPLSAWQPTLADVERLVQGPGQAGKQIDIHEIGTTQYEWLLPVRDLSDYELQLRDRRVRHEQWAGIGFAVIMIGLGLQVGVGAVQMRRRHSRPGGTR